MLHGAVAVVLASLMMGPVDVKLEPVQVPGGLANADRERLQDAARQGLERAKITVADGAPNSVRVVITRKNSDYVVTGTVTSAGGNELATAQEVCELCGITELGDTIVAVGGRLGQRLALTDEEATLKVESRPAGAEVLIDGEWVGSTPLETKIPSGDHTLEVRKKGYRDDSRKFNAEGGSTGAFALTLQRDRYRRWLPWTSLAVGLAGIGAGAGLLVIDGREIRQDCNPDIDGRCQYVHATLAGGATLTAVGAALVVTGVALAIAWRDAFRDPDDRRARVRAGPGSIGVRFAP